MCSYICKTDWTNYVLLHGYWKTNITDTFDCDPYSIEMIDHHVGIRKPWSNQSVYTYINTICLMLNQNSSQTMATWQQQNTNGNTSNNNNNNNHNNNNNNKKKKKKHTPKTINAKMKINTWPLSVHHQQLKAWPQQPPEWMAGIFDIQIIWVFPKIGIPQNGWFIMENPIKMDDLGGNTILGKIHMIIYVIRSSRVDVDIQKHFTHTYPSVLYCMTIICACSITIKDYTYHLRFTHICDSTLLESMHFEEIPEAVLLCTVLGALNF